MEKKKGLRIYVNEELYAVLVDKEMKPSQIIAAVLEPFADTVKYWSPAAVREAISGAEELAMEALGKKVRRVDWRVVKAPPLSVFYNILLTAEGKGLMHGFGTCTSERGEGGKQRVITHHNINPEWQTVKKE